MHQQWSKLMEQRRWANSTADCRTEMCSESNNATRSEFSVPAEVARLLSCRVWIPCLVRLLATDPSAGRMSKLLNHLVP